MDNKKIYRHALTIASVMVLMTVGLTIYEIIKQITYPHISVWGSHMTTIVVGGLLGGIVAYFILKRYEKYEQINLKTMETLRETSDFNLSLVKAIPFGMDIVDLKGNILFVSERLQTILGRDVVGEKCWDIYHDKKEQCNLCPLRHRDMSYGTGTVEVDGVFGGRSFQISHVSMIYKGEQAVLEVFNDITEQKRAERDLAKSRDFYLTLFEEFPGLIWRSGLDAKCNYFNKTWLTFTGRTIEEESGDGWVQGIHPDDLPRRMDIYQRAFSVRIPFVMEYRLHRHDGEYRWIVENGRPFNDINGDFAGFIGACFDVTEPKMIGEALRESEERYRQLIEMLPDAIIVHSQEQIVYTNRAAALLLGCLDSGHVVGKNINSIVHPDYHQTKGRRIAKIMETGESAPLIEEQFIQSDGSIIDVEAASKPILYQGKPSILSVIRDITERKKVQRALEESESRYYSLFQGNHSVMLLIDPDQGIIIDANEAAFTFYGYDKDALIGKSMDQINTIKSELIFERMRMVKENVKHHFVVQQRLANGEIRDVKVYSGPIKVLGKELIYSIVHDVTESKRAEEELRKLSRAIEQSASSVVITDTQGSIEYINPKFTSLTGYTSEEVLGKNPRMLKSGEMSPEEYKKLWSTISMGSEWQGEFHNRKKNGELYWEYASISPIRDREGKITHYLAVKEDMTELKKAQEELQRAKEAAESANHAKSEFLANMSHEIRTPMNGIIGMTELLLETELSNEQRDYLQMVQTSADDLLLIINDILDFSKIEAGKIELEKEELNLQTLVEKTAETFALRAHHKGLELICYVDPMIPRRLIGDPRRIRQVLVNLIGNALKFTEKGEILVKANRESGENNNFTVSILIKDTGIGIPRNKMDRLFKSFSQVDGSMTRKYGGTGLGLAISKNLVEMMGGTIGVESVEGEGSIFHFTIPFAVPRENVDSRIEHQTMMGLRVLIVDDNATNRFILREVLTGWGMKVTFENDGQRVLEHLKKQNDAGEPYQLLLLDAQMPIKDGFQVLREIDGDPALRELKRILLTSLAIPDPIMIEIKDKMDACILKPVKQSELFDKILSIMHRRGEGSVGAPSPSKESSPREDFICRVLLAEDNPVNQKLVSTMLGKMGCQVKTVGNGRRVLKALESATYDLILMDIQMPELDGYETTYHLRMQERDNGGHIPIIALTAHVMKGDKERCLDAGMDGYLSKPIKRDELQSVIEKYAHCCSEKAAVWPERDEPYRSFDLSVLVNLMDGDEALAIELLSDYVDDVVKQIERLQVAFSDQNDHAILEITHRIKGTSGNLGIQMIYELTTRIEQYVKIGETENALKLIKPLRNEINHLNHFVTHN